MITAPNGEKIAIVVAWHNTYQINHFLRAWNESEERDKDYLFLQYDEWREGCAKTKNKAVARAAEAGADIVVILDDDCLPHLDPSATLTKFALKHWQALQPCKVELFRAVTKPNSRGTPFLEQNRFLELEVAASMGFWSGTPDFDAATELTHPPSCQYCMGGIFGKYFPLSGMNLAFRPKQWLPWCQFIDVPRYDDIWMGLLFQKEAYRRGFCFNLNGPMVNHQRQSNVFANLRIEASFAEENETLWRKIHTSQETSYEALRKLLPCSQ